MGLTSLRRHKEEWAAKGIIIKPTTIKDIIGEELHESGLTMREYNEIVDQIKNQKSTTISEPPDNESHENKNGDIRRWEDESPAIKETINAQEKEGQQEERQTQELEEIDLAAEMLKTVSAPIKPRRAYNKKKTE
mgnify:CR=1 FL=1